VIVRAEPCEGQTEVVLSTPVLAILRDVFGPDFEHQRHCVKAAVAFQLDVANVAGELPRVGAAGFRAEVVEVRLSGNAGREVSGFLLSVAGMDAIAAYLCARESSRAGAASDAAPGTSHRSPDPMSGTSE
jgi:hypothetical protein